MGEIKYKQREELIHLFREFYYKDNYINECINDKNMTDVTRKIFAESLLALGFIAGSVMIKSECRPNICNDEDAEVLIDGFEELKKVWENKKEEKIEANKNALYSLLNDVVGAPPRPEIIEDIGAKKALLAYYRDVLLPRLYAVEKSVKLVTALCISERFIATSDYTILRRNYKPDEIDDVISILRKEALPFIKDGCEDLK